MMPMMWYSYPQFTWFHPFILAPFIVLDLILRGLALWRSARNGQLYWFIGLLVINTVGILPAIYLLFFQERPQAKSA